MRAVLGDDQRLRFGEIEHLTRDVVRRHHRAQRRATCRAALRIMVDRGIRGFGPAQSLARMALLPARLLARRLPQAAHPGRLLQPVAGGRFAAVAAVQSEPALQFANARLLRQQQRDQVVFRELAERGAIHRILESTAPPFVKQNLRRIHPKPTKSCSLNPLAHVSCADLGSNKKTN